MRSGYSSALHYSNVSVALSAESKENESDSKDDCDDDVMRYNKRLKDRRDRTLKELKRLENENKMHCDKLRALLKPLHTTDTKNKEKKAAMNSKIKKWDAMIAEHISKYSENSKNKKFNALDGIEEFKIPPITEKMSDAQRKDFLSLLIRYLCLANNYQRNEIKSLYAKQRSLYFQAQGLSLHEQRQYLETLSRPIPAFQPIDKQNNAALQQLLAKFPDPHDISDKYEQYTRLIKQVNVISQDTDTNWQSSVIKTSIDDLQPMGYNANPSSPASPTAVSPTLTNKYSSFSRDDDAVHSGTVSRTKHKAKKSLFGFRKKKSTEKVAHSVDPKREKSLETESATATNEMSVSSSAMEPTLISQRSISYDTQKAVAMMGSKANAPNVASMSRNTAISGARLVRFDANYKQLQSRRQRCDIASIVAALQNTHNMHTRMKQRVPNELGKDPFLCEQNFGFDMRYCDGKMYTFDTNIDDKEMLRKYKEELQKNNQAMTPATTGHINAANSISSLALNSPRPQTAHFAAQSSLTNIQGWEALLSHTQGGGSGSSRNLHSLINATDDVDSKSSKEDESARKWSNDMAHAFTEASKTVMNVNKEKESSRPGWITLNQFIYLATNFGAHGMRDAQVLVLTHKIFCDSKALLKGLRRRFWMPLPPNITPSEMTAFRQTFVKQIRGKIIAVLRYWLTKHWCDDFRDEVGLQRRMNKFITEIFENKDSESMSIYLAQAFAKEKKANTIKSLFDGRAKLQTAQKKKVVKFFYDAKTMDILDFDPGETAACIVELNCKSFLLIDQRECFEFIKNKEKGPNVASMIARWNAMGNWVQRELLSQRRDFKKRLQCLRYFIHIVSILSDLGDFSGAYAINSALHSTPVHRLKTYFDELTRKEHNTLKEMRVLFKVSGNYPKLRQEMKNYLSKPCVPHIGLFTRDLTMLAENDSTKMINNGKYINFGKCQTLAKLMNDLKMYQNNINKFNLQYQKPLLDYVETQLENPIKTENDLYKMSIQVEPKSTM